MIHVADLTQCLSVAQILPGKGSFTHTSLWIIPALISFFQITAITAALNYPHETPPQGASYNYLKYTFR